MCKFGKYIKEYHAGNYLGIDGLFSGCSENFFLLSFVFYVNTFVDKSLIK